MTLRELAKMANVSVGTVSKAFHHSPEIPEATRERIFAIARQAGCYYKYRQDKQERRVVAIICREIQSDNYVRMIEYLQSRLKRAQIDVLISFDDFDDKDEKHYGLAGSATQVERIFPPDKKNQKCSVEVNTDEQATTIFELLLTKKMI